MLRNAVERFIAYCIPKMPIIFDLHILLYDRFLGKYIKKTAFKLL